VLSRVIVKKRRGRRALAVMSLTAITVGTLVLGNAVLAVNATGAFELEGNAITNHGAGTPDDWDRVCYQNAVNAVADGGLGLSASDATTLCTASVGTPTANAVAWLDAAADPIIFTGGGSKDPQDPQDSWLWKPSDTIPDKDTILHAYAARYSLTPDDASCPSNGAPTCDVIFFGSDRFDNAGDAQLGFWFFKNEVGRTDPPVASNGGFKFKGHHANGDLLVISDFSNGGTTSTIKVYFWDTSCGSDNTKANKVVSNPKVGDCGANNLRLELSSDTANCSTSTATAAACGIVNSSNGTTSPWPFLDKTGHTAYQQGEFYEAGLNLSKLGLAGQCFSSFEAESRASTSPTATLKALAIGGFGSCETTVTTVAGGVGGAGSIGSGSVSSGSDTATVSVSGTSTWGGTLTWYLCGPVSVDGCDSSGVQVTSRTVSNASPASDFVSGTATLTSAGRYCWTAHFEPDTATAAKGVGSGDDDGTNECFTVTKVTPSLTTNAGDDVDFGNPVTDSATLSGAATEPGTNGSNTTYPSINATPGAYAGTITFTLKGPSTSGCGTSPATGTGTNPQTINVDTTTGNKTYTGISFTPDSPGTFHWVATYTNTGSANNTSPVTDNAACDQTREDVVVNQVQTAITTRQFVFPQDKATVTASGGGALAGSITFKLYNSASNCAANGATGLLYTEGPLSVSGASPQSKTTNNTSARVTADTTGIYWRVTYTSTNQAQLGSSSVCVESTAITYSGNDGTISIP